MNAGDGAHTAGCSSFPLGSKILRPHAAGGLADLQAFMNAGTKVQPVIQKDCGFSAE